MPTIIVLSNRRSGTHLALNFIKKNLRLPFKFYSICDSRQKHRLNPKGNFLIKTHFDYKDYDIELFNKCCGNSKFFQESKKVFVCRNPVKVMNSSYYYYQSCVKRTMKFTMKQFVENKDNKYFKPVTLDGWISFMNHFISNEKEYDLCIISYEEIVNCPDETIEKISSFSGIEKNDVVIKHNDKGFNNGVAPIAKRATKSRSVDPEIETFIIEKVKSELLPQVKERLKDVQGFEFLN